MVQQPQEDSRVAATSKIWGMTVGMFVICIPLSAVTRSGPLLPLAALGGAVAGTVAVWRGDEQKSGSKSLSKPPTETLEQRIANLETIVSSEEFELHRKIQALESDTQPSTPEHKT
ncbi:MAG: hypothetical protein ACRAVC_21975 [Trichormus sp.]